MAVHDFRSQRLYVDVPLHEGASFEVPREQANYLLNVLRLKTDNQILVFNGKVGEWRACIEATGRKKCQLHIMEPSRPQPAALPLVYCFAPLKQARLDYMIQKAVELGAGVLQPVITQYTQVRSVNKKRLMSNAIEAAEQCGILTLPQIHSPIPLAKLMEELGSETHLVFCDEAEHVANPLAELQARKHEKLALLIGPEGGFSDEERLLLKEYDNVTKLGLGPRILRADTAAVAAMAILQAQIGDWYK